MNKKLRVTKVDKKNRAITVDNCVDFKSVPIVELPIWSGTMHSLDELSGITGQLTKEDLEKKYPKMECEDE
jgi:hypothetical protein